MTALNCTHGHPRSRLALSSRQRSDWPQPLGVTSRSGTRRIRHLWVNMRSKMVFTALPLPCPIIALIRLVKPFSPTELTARAWAALRRSTRPEPFALGELAIHYEERRVTVAGRPVELTATEYELLRVLSQNAGRRVDYDTLLGRVWSGRK